MPGLLYRVFQSHSLLAWLSLAALPAAAQPAGPREAGVDLLTVCELAERLQAQDTEPFAVVGRFSFREHGHYLSESACPRGPDGAAPVVFEIVYDGKTGPVPPARLGFGQALVESKLASVQAKTRLAEFRFGAAEYDRWALVFGRIGPPPAQKEKGEQSGRKEFSRTDGRIVCRSPSMVVPLAVEPSLGSRQNRQGSR